MNKLTIASLFSAIGIALGAFGAHGLEAKLAANGSSETWKTAVLYHLIHALALFVLATNQSLKAKWTFRLWVAGIALFSGSLYALALTKFSALGPITPLGGLAFIAGWIVLIFEGRSGHSTD